MSIFNVPIMLVGRGCFFKGLKVCCDANCGRFSFIGGVV